MSSRISHDMWSGPAPPGAAQLITEQKEAIARLMAEVAERDAALAVMRQSTFWRATMPLRVLTRALRQLRRPRSALLRARGIVRRSMAARGVRGPLGALAVARAKLREWRQGGPGRLRDPTNPAYGAGIAAPPQQVVGPRVVLVAELGLAQCAKYRVWQKFQHITALGVACEVIPWWEDARARSALQLASMVIFYRVPAWPPMLALMAEARRLGLAVMWEVDDLIFDEEGYRANPNVQALEPALRDSVIQGVPLYRTALQQADIAIASTPVLAAAMRRFGPKRAWIIENGLDAETLEIAADIRAARQGAARQGAARQGAAREGASPGDGLVRIVYGSGSKAHDADFLHAAAALLRVLAARPELRLRLIGDLVLPAGFAQVQHQVERLPGVPYDRYLQLLGAADISIAPLPPMEFNDAKSSIKFLEAAILGLPSVCSAREPFRAAIVPGETGFLAETEAEWFAALDALAGDADLRQRMGAAALQHVQLRFAAPRIATMQVAPLLAEFAPPPRRKPRVLVGNVYFAPESFGGATIVAEALARALHAGGQCEVVVFTSCPAGLVPEYQLHRYESDGISVIATPLPQELTLDVDHHNPRMGALFADVLRAVRPDVVHLHAIQGISATLAEEAENAGIPTVITLHDAWWLCERQFMVRRDGRSCLQTRVDWAVCAGCVDDLGFSMRRRNYLMRVLHAADAVLVPSAWQRQLHVANGVPEALVRINRNGVRRPGRLAARRVDPARVRLGYVGGAGPMKGLDLIHDALDATDARNFELVLVDNTLNLGYASIKLAGWKIADRTRVVPAYAQDALDEFFAGIDVLLFPSQVRESFGLTVREALLRDVWVITTDAGGAAEDVIEGINGTIIPIGADPAPLRAAIEAILRDPRMLDGYANPAKARIATVEQQAAELATVLREVVGK